MSFVIETAAVIAMPIGALAAFVANLVSFRHNATVFWSGIGVFSVGFLAIIFV